MGSLFKYLTDFIKDKTTTWGFKTALFISIITLVCLTDYFVGFSKNYHFNNKIEQLEKLTKLKQAFLTDSTVLKEFQEMESKVIQNKHYSERLSSLFSKENESKNLSSSKIKGQNESSKNADTTNRSVRSIFLMALSSNYLIAIILPFLVFLPFYNKESRTGKGILSWFSSLVILAIMITIFTWFAYLIPLIGNNPNWNYLLNIVMHSVFWFAIIMLGKKNK